MLDYFYVSTFVSWDKLKKTYKDNYTFFKKWSWRNQMTTHKRIKLCINVIAYAKFDLKWIIDLNVRVKAIKPLEGNTEMNLNYPESGNSFLDMTPKA